MLQINFVCREGREIIKKIDSLIKDDENFDIDKAQTYCNFCLSFKKDSLDKDLFNKCKKCLDDVINCRDIKYTLEHISRSRKMV